MLLLLGAMDENSLSVKDAVVHRPAKIAERLALEALPEITLLADPPEQSLGKLASQIGKAGAQVPWAKQFYLLAAGPILDGPDRVEVHSLTQHQGKLTLQVYHTSARLSGTPLLRNIRWRPLVQVPLELTPGKWEITTEWIPYSNLPNGKPLEKPTSYSTQIDVLLKK